MNWPKRFLVCGIYSVMLLICATVICTLLNRIAGGPPATLRIDQPFLFLWMGGALILGWLMLFDLWYVFLFFGCWIAFFPPRKRLAWLAFLVVAIAAGLLASHDFQPLHPWEAEDADGGIVSPPPGPTAVYSNVLACITALSSTTLCYLAVRRWFLHPPPGMTPSTSGTGGESAPSCLP